MSTDEKETLKDNNTLLLSEKEQKAFLPYKIIDIQKFLEYNPEYENKQEIINKLYIVPFDLYKNPILSRFKESFNLARSEHYSLKKSIDLGLELMFKYNLNPAIITACKNMDELDIYLACLDNNDLQNFMCFDIVYDFSPVVVAIEENQIKEKLETISENYLSKKAKLKTIYKNILTKKNKYQGKHSA